MQDENKLDIICAEIYIDYSIGCLTGTSYINRIAIGQPMSKRKLNFKNFILSKDNYDSLFCWELSSSLLWDYNF